jgi:pimeloyl-ACP methyl ester carboxylesterase
MNISNIKIYENQDQAPAKTLVIAHWYARCWNYYSEISKKIIEQTPHKRVLTFDFPGHDKGKSDLSFSGSLDRLSEVLQFVQSEYWNNTEIWWHSYGAFITAFLLNNNHQLDLDIRKSIQKLYLSSLPISMENKHPFTKYAEKKIWKKNHQEMCEWLLIHKIKKLRTCVQDWNLVFWDLNIPDWSKFTQEFLDLPTLKEINNIEIPTTIIRARVDAVLWLYTHKNKQWNIWFITSPIHTASAWDYHELNDKFTDQQTCIINWARHWMQVPSTHTLNKNKKQVDQLIEILST